MQRVLIGVDIDCRSTVLRVHLSGDDVLSLVLLCAWPGARSDFDYFHRWCGDVHFVDNLVSA